MTDADKIAEFLAKRGATRIAAGETALDYTPRDWHRAVRGEPTQYDLISERRLVATDHAGRDFWVNGLGERIT